MGGFPPDTRPSPAAVVRRFLLVACLAASIPVVWGVGEIAAELEKSTRATAAYQLGVDLQTAGRLEEAADAFRSAIALSPRMVEAYRKLAKAEAVQGRYDAAIATYRQIMAEYPFSRFSPLYREVGLIELYAGRLEEAHDDLLQAVAHDPRDWRAHNLLGLIYQRQGDMKQAAAARMRARELRTRELRESFRRL